MSSWGRAITRPVSQGYRRRGPGPHDLDRLERGELESLVFGGRYRLEGPLGRGSTARVFAGRHLRSGREVAVKILHDRHCGDHRVLTRLLREGRIGAYLRHDNIVAVLDFGSTPEGLVYLVMERLRGESLRALIGTQPTPSWSWVRAVMLPICAGVSAMHDVGLVHRDLTSSHCVVLDRPGPPQLKLADLGLATFVRRGVASVRDGTGRIVGTPRSMSPEHARGAAVDVRSDVFAAGILLGELLTGRVPFPGETPAAVLTAQRRRPWPTLARLAPPGVVIDPRVQAIFERAVQPDPDDRFASIDAMADAIRAIEPAEPAVPPSRGPSPDAAPSTSASDEDRLIGRFDAGISPRLG